MTDPFTHFALQLVSPHTQLAHARTEDGAAILQSLSLAAIIRERIDQVERHGFDAHHDDLHDECEIARGALAYVTAGLANEIEDDPGAALEQGLALWPWVAGDMFRPTDYHGCLIKAAAMLWAEADRVGRAQELIDAVRGACDTLGENGQRTCRRCGCTQARACVTDDGPCFWIAEDLCSACAGKPDPAPAPAHDSHAAFPEGDPPADGQDWHG